MEPKEEQLIGTPETEPDSAESLENSLTNIESQLGEISKDISADNAEEMGKKVEELQEELSLLEKEDPESDRMKLLNNKLESTRTIIEMNK